MPRDVAPGRLQAHFKDADFSQHGSRWDSLWKDSYTPWDRGSPSMALNDVLADRKELFPSPPDPADGRRKTALVPGCGRGYDVLLLSALGYDTYGLDTSENAINEAKEVQTKVGGDEVYQAREGIKKGNITWLMGDFFKDDFLHAANVGKFDLIYDYTVSRQPDLSHVIQPRLAYIAHRHFSSSAPSHPRHDRPGRSVCLSSSPPKAGWSVSSFRHPNRLIWEALRTAYLPTRMSPISLVQGKKSPMTKTAQ